MASEGYDLYLVEQGGYETYKCPICHLLVRDAHQLNCCGKLFCRNCLMKHMKSVPRPLPWVMVEFNCPCCRKKLEFENEGRGYFQDTRSNQEIQSLKVYCTHKFAGCKWTGELRHERGHSDACQYMTISCSKCNQKMPKHNLCFHTSSKCPMRIYKCPLCGEQDTYKSITGEHKSKCPKVLLSCKNPACYEKIKRCEMAIHRQSCPKEVINCPYSNVGCIYSAEREIIEVHVKEDTELHLSIAVKRVTEMQLQPKAVCPMIIKFSCFSHYKELDEKSFSPGVYTCEGGYKFRLCIYPNGAGDGKDDHVSVFINVMPGEYDDTLEWPLRGKFTVSMLNQLENRNHYGLSISFDENTKNSACKKEKEDESGWGLPKFTLQSYLGFNSQSNTQYLKDDTLYFRVDVTLHSTTKPWLTTLSQPFY